MKVIQTLQKYRFPKQVADILARSGCESFYPPQEQAIKKGLLENQSILMAVPTAAGKTLMAELCMLKSILENNGRCLYIAPLKALASEKFEDFKEKYSALGIKVGIATGDLDSPSKMLNRYQILIATAEKVDSLLRSRAKWLISALNVLVLDEIHFLNDVSRGPTLEILTARIKQINHHIQIVALSATVSNADEIAKWLKAKAVISRWRPVPLKEGVYFNEKINFYKDATRLIKEEPHDDLSKLVIDTLRSKGQVLVFVNSRRSAQAASRIVGKAVAQTLSPDEKKKLTAISKQLLGLRGEATKICQKLADTAVNGSAFHHAGLKPRQRKLIEENFKKNIIKVICSTPTLAAGVNLPARRAIIRDCKRYEAGLGSTYIPTFEYKQCAGRAGRPKYDQFGEAVIVAKSPNEVPILFERYIEAEPEPVISKLGSESALRMHILSSIAGGYVHDVQGMFEFISHTFLSHQKQTIHMIETISHIFDFLTQKEFIEKSGFRYFATAFGQCISRLYIDPITGLILRDGLKKMQQKQSFSPVGILHLLCCTPDTDLLHLGKSDYGRLEYFASTYADEFIVTAHDLPALEDFYHYLSTLKTTSLYLEWINEKKEDLICEEFGIGPGDVYRHTESARWLLHACGVIAELDHHRQLTFILEELSTRMKYGILEDLLELISLKNIGRHRARQLHNKGVKTLQNLRTVSLDDLASIPQIGKTLAESILSQVNKKRYS